MLSPLFVGHLWDYVTMKQRVNFSKMQLKKIWIVGHFSLTNSGFGWHAHCVSGKVLPCEIHVCMYVSYQLKKAQNKHFYNCFSIVVK